MKTPKAPHFLVESNTGSKIQKIIGIVSGKGGVGKSFVTCQLANEMVKRGYKVGILDADITGPSIPKYYGLKDKALSDEDGHIMPVITKNNIKVISINLLLKKEDDAVVWRGPVINGVVKQFYQDVIWEELDYLFVDMPPGTGDVPLTVFQALPVDGVVIATTPSNLVDIIVKKAIHMAKMMGVPILGIVENMSYLKCPNCEEEISVFGTSNVDEVGRLEKIKEMAKIPIDPKIARLAESGNIHRLEMDGLESIIDTLED